jgi:hypothetical protein
VTAADIESELRTAAKIASLNRTGIRGTLSHAGALGAVPLLLLVGVAVARGNRRQRGSRR